MSALPRARTMARAVIKRAGGRPLAAARRRAQHPELSVVMPVYNVAEFLDEAIDSVLGQDFRNLELIAIDDSSTDGSLDILRRRARLDHRLVVITQPNAGQGAARNTGVDVARGEFLTFVDSDDVVPQGAYEHMVASLRASGSDFSVGSVVRLRHREILHTAWVRTVHSRDRIGVTLDEFPNAMQDIICCNRMFRTEFWREKVGGFEAHIAYEDHVPMLAAYVRATKFDILAKVTYHWRVRLSSTGHKKADIGNLLDRIEVKEQAHELLRTEASDFVYDLWVGRTLEVDFPPFLRIARSSDEVYRNLVTATCRTFLDRANERAMGFVRVANKIRGQLAAEGRWDDLADVDAWLGADATKLPPTQIRDGKVVATAPEQASFLDGLPASALEMAPTETHFQGVMQSAQWEADRILVGGWTALRGVSASPGLTHRAWLTDGAESIPLEVRTTPNPRANIWGQQEYADYSGGGFEVSVPFDVLPPRTASWQLFVEMTMDGLTVDGPLDFRMLESGAVVPVGGVLRAGGTRLGVQVGWTRGGGCRIEVVADPTVVESVTVPGHGTVTGTLSAAATDVRFQSRGRVQPVRLTPQPDGRTTFRASLPERGVWTLRSDAGDVLWEDAGLRDGPDPMHPSRRGGLQVLSGLPHLEVTALDYDSDSLTLTAVVEHLGLDEAGLARIDLGSARTSLAPASITTEGSTSTFTWSLTDASFGLPRHQLASQQLRFRYQLDDGFLEIKPSRALGGSTPFWHETETFDVKVAQVREGALVLTLQPPLGLDQRGVVNQTRLREAYLASTDALTDTAFFQCYRGEFATDSQYALDRAIAERFPEMERVWGVQDPGTRLPEGSRGVVMNSPEWYDAIATSRFLTNNIDFGGWFRRRDGQAYLQTFHGYPFKSMGIGFWQAKATSQDQVDRLVERVNSEWDKILVPSEFCVALYRREYSFEGEILVAGYPRTDALVNSDAQAVRQRVLAGMGIDPSKRVVLYAPTYRDKLTTQTYAAERFAELDLDRLLPALGEDHVLLLRGHNNNQRHSDRLHGVAQVVDVTDYPEINDLTLAADVAILDYSSLRFDWAITGKPMIFFVPDLEDYFDLRPPLFGFEESAPGPLLRTTDDVIAHLLDLSALERAHRADIAAFNQRFNELNDGNASARVLDAMFPDA